jgi:hypothetical protein
MAAQQAALSKASRQRNLVAYGAQLARATLVVGKRELACELRMRFGTPPRHPSPLAGAGSDDSGQWNPPEYLRSRVTPGLHGWGYLLSEKDLADSPDDQFKLPSSGSRCLHPPNATPRNICFLTKCRMWVICVAMSQMDNTGRF